MGLDISHDTWHGAYSAFMRWRQKIAELAGMPPLELMEGFYYPLDGSIGHPTLYPGNVDKTSFSLETIDQRLPIKWEALKPSPLHTLLLHSDCDGEIEWKELEGIANELEKLLPLFKDEDGGGHIGNYQDKTKTFIDGCRLAFSKKENLLFR